jgi:hypothetical protein
MDQPPVEISCMFRCYVGYVGCYVASGVHKIYLILR